jgi:hypothetical protein
MLLSGSDLPSSAREVFHLLCRRGPEHETSQPPKGRRECCELQADHPRNDTASCGQVRNLSTLGLRDFAIKSSRFCRIIGL